MPLQRRLLYAMLTLLGLAALAGVSTIFLPGGRFLLRVAFTLVTGAIGIAIAMPASRLLEKQDQRTNGLYALGAVVFGFCLALVAIWGDFFFGTGVSEPFGLTLLAYLGCALPASIFIALRRFRAGRLTSIVGLFACGVCFAFALPVFWGPRVGVVVPDDKIGMTIAIIAWGTLPMCASLFGTFDDRKSWRWLGVLLGGAAIAMGFYGIWIKSSDDPTWLAQALIMASAVGGANVLIRLPLRPGQRWLAYATIATLVLTAIAASFDNISTSAFQHTSPDDLSVRFFAAGCIVTVCGILAIAVLMGFNRRVLVTEARSLDEIRKITVACPRCAKRQDAAVGESRCEGCGLIFLFRFAEPRCTTCNYSLLDIKSGICPECGEKIAAATSDSPATFPAPSSNR